MPLLNDDAALMYSDLLESAPHPPCRAPSPTSGRRKAVVATSVATGIYGAGADSEISPAYSSTGI